MGVPLGHGQLEQIIAHWDRIVHINFAFTPANDFWASRPNVRCLRDAAR